MTYLNDAIAKGDLQTVRILIENQGYSPNDIGFTGLNDTPLTVAAQFGHRKIMDYLISKGADVNAKGYYFGYGSTPMETALKYGHTQVVVDLLANNAILPQNLHKTDIANQYLLKAANANDTWSIEKLLTHTEADINTHDNFMKRTPLHNAVMSDSLDATFKLIDKGAKVNAIDMHSWTPLHYAASNSDTQFAKLLIESGAKVNAQDYSNRTPLFSAVLSGEEELVNLLVKNGGKINHTDKEGTSALDLAIINDDADMIKCLYFNGAKISAGIGNTTPLEFAAESGKLQAIEALIQVGSSLSHKNAQGKTALELAFKAGEMGAVNMLKMYGAEVPKYIQDKLDTMKKVEAEQVLPEDSILTHSDQENTSTSSTQEDITYSQPIGPSLPSMDPDAANIAFG
jgi:ankyrin repeat protein